MVATTNNITKNEKRMVSATFVIRGYMRLEENHSLAVPAETAQKFPREIQEYLGYYQCDASCGYVEQMDAIYALLSELNGEAGYKDF